MKINPKDYRPNVGMMIINQNKEIFVGNPQILNINKEEYDYHDLFIIYFF